MKKQISRIFALVLAVCLVFALSLNASASTINRAFTGGHGKQFTVDGTSTYANGVATLNFSQTGAACWSYVSDVTDLHFQVQIDTDCDPEYEWFGVNVTNDGFAMLGEGSGLSTLFWRDSTSINTRVVRDQDGARWNDVAGKEIMTNDLYTGEKGFEYPNDDEDFRWGDGDWIDFHMVRNANGKWDVRVNDISILRTPYATFDSEMDSLFQNADKVTLTLFLSNASGVLRVRGAGENTSTGGGSNAKKGGKDSGKDAETVSGSTKKSSNKKSGTGEEIVGEDDSAVESAAENAESKATVSDEETGIAENKNAVTTVVESTVDAPMTALGYIAIGVSVAAGVALIAAIVIFIIFIGKKKKPF